MDKSMDGLKGLGIEELGAADLAAIVGGMSQTCTSYSDGSSICTVHADNGKDYTIIWGPDGHAVH